MTINGTGSGSGWAGGTSQYNNQSVTGDSTAESSSGYASYTLSSDWCDQSGTDGYGYQDGWNESYGGGSGSGWMWGSGMASGSSEQDTGYGRSWLTFSSGGWSSGWGNDGSSSSGSWQQGITSPGFYYGGGLGWSPFATGGPGLGYGQGVPGAGGAMGPSSVPNEAPAGAQGDPARAGGWARAATHTGEVSATSIVPTAMGRGARFV